MGPLEDRERQLL